MMTSEGHEARIDTERLDNIISSNAYSLHLLG